MNSHEVLKSMWPVGRQLVGDETTRDLSDNVAPEEGTVDQPHRLWVPVKLSFLERKKGLSEENEEFKKIKLWHLQNK